MDQFDVPVNEDGKIIDFLSANLLEPGPEEFVRQRYLRILHFEMQYPKSVLQKEVPIYYGRNPLKDEKGNPVRADIVVYKSASASSKRDQGRVSLIVECKAPTEDSGYNQLASYIFNTSADGGVWCNGDEVRYYRRLTDPSNDLIPWTGIPRKGEEWDALGRRLKSDFRRPKDIKGLLRRCHNKLHGRGVDGEEEDLTMDMVRLILAKAMDEELPGEYPEFYCTPEEYSSNEGQKGVAKRVSGLFEEVINSNPDVFSEQERISVGNRAICDVVIELQGFRLLSDLNESEDWDIMGHAYEQYTATYLKRTRGQFFTNRLVVDFMVQILNPNYQDIILDPAGGSGGFLTGVMRYVRQTILSSKATKIAKQRQLDRHRTRLFMVEISRRLVKIAKTAMILNGDGHTGMTQGDSIGPFDDLDDSVIALAGKGKPTIILTNPPFAGVGEGRITDSKVLDNFSCGMRWTTRGTEYQPTDSVLTDGVPPEMLFFERCLQWIAPGGKVGIVMPKSFLDTQTYLPARMLLLRNFKLLGVVNCHKDTFRPHTGVRTCLVFIELPKLPKELESDYDIFLAISRKIGQDSEGFPIFKRDKDNNLTDEIDHDLDEILESFQACQDQVLVPSAYHFSIKRSEIDEKLRINPQAYLPHLNETIRQIESIDEDEAWSVSTLGQITQDIKIFKGPRLKSENIIVEDSGPNVEPYYTPSAVLQEKSDSVKLLDVSRAVASQLRAIQSIRVERGDIVITRSGTIGRVAFITKRLDNAIVSDDLIRVKIKDEDIRLYVLSYLQSQMGQNQMLRNEYGSVQQHLEPQHVADILIPIPDDWSQVSDVIEGARDAIKKKEEMESATSKAADAMTKMLDELFS
ncbi:MAG: N-6 DNA methylase [Gemmatimonadetes bacterium]|nr:N-6 DNA methylase [Gemmatimonadota bacterium]